MNVVRRWARCVAPLFLAALALAACTSSGGAATEGGASPLVTSLPETTTTVTVGVNPSITSLPIFVALARGYFADQHLDVKTAPITSSVDAMPLLATGRIDTFLAAPGAALINAVKNGVNAKYVATFGHPRMGGPNSAFIAKKGGPITDVASLKRRKVAVAGGEIGVGAFLLSELLKQGDLTLDSVKVVDLTMPDAVVALDNNSVDAAYVLGQTAKDLETAGKDVQIGDMDAVLARGTGVGLIFGDRLLRKDTSAGLAFLRGIQRAAQDLQGDYMHDSQILEILSNAVKLPQDVLAAQAATAPIVTTDLTISPSFFERLQQFFLDRGVIAGDQAITTSQAFDLRFAGVLKPAAG